MKNENDTRSYTCTKNTRVLGNKVRTLVYPDKITGHVPVPDA